MTVTTSIFRKISSIQKQHVNIFCNVFHTNPLANLEIADRNSFTLFNKTGSLRINGNIQTRWGNYCCCGKPVRITFSECVSVALFSLQLRRMLRIILPSVACLALPYLSTLSHKRYDFRKQVMECKTC